MMGITKEDVRKIAEIRDRAISLNIASNKTQLFMDLMGAVVYYDIDTDKMFKLNDYEFKHDIIGISKNIDRSAPLGSHAMFSKDPYFVPISSRKS